MADPAGGYIPSDFQRIAIVNRGEAAIRLIHAVCELNREREAQHAVPLRTIALCTNPERRAMFVREADEAVCLGPATFLDPHDGQRKSAYLDYQRLEEAPAGGTRRGGVGGLGFRRRARRLRRPLPAARQRLHRPRA